MFVRKDQIKTVDEYIKDLENMRVTLTDLPDEAIDCLIRHAEAIKHREHEYVWVYPGPYALY